MKDTSGSEVILESLLDSIDLARDQGLGRVFLKARDLAEQFGWDETDSTPAICQILESQWFEEQARVTLVHRVGIRGRPETAYMFDVLGSCPKQGATGLWRRLRWWWQQLSLFECTALMLAGAAMLLALLALWWAGTMRAGTGWPVP